MKRSSLISPVLIELVIVILFFGLSSQAVLQLIAAAVHTSRESERKSAAMIAAMDIMENVRHDPAASVDPEPVVTRSGEELTFWVTVTASATGAGQLYDIMVSAQSGGETVLTLTGARYVPGGAA